MKPIQRGWRSSVPEASGTMLRMMLAPNSIPSDKVLIGMCERQQKKCSGMDLKRGLMRDRGLVGD